MSGVRDRLKGLPEKGKGLREQVSGWRPEKGKGIREQVTGVFRKGDSELQTTHSARPISELRDPSSFGPPPKHVAAYGGTPMLPPPGSASRQQQPPGIPSTSPTTAPAGYSSSTISPAHDAEDPPPPKPYRVNTTGLSTANLPAPPVRRAATAEATAPPPPYSPSGAAGARPGPPSLPPRLPPRGGSGSPTASSPGQQTAAPLLNQGAIGRLGAAGISVPGLGIGKGSSSSSSAASPKSPQGGAAAPSRMSGLQSRFTRLGTTSPATDSSPSPPGEGTTLAQKQAALKTAANFRRDPSSVSLADARSAASTANNFRQRHGEQVGAGLRAADGINQKYAVADRVGTAYDGGRGQGQGQERAGGAATALAAPGGLIGKKKPAPPPPRKKPELSAGRAAADDTPPPPVPLATRPQF